ncbi:MAG: hypothetical protein DWQ05_08170 [Calditrichaeota bacterium]|nr:MAG: hypothetical protein DWQ05_08170 [Calditrichota bacterium]
MARHVPGFFYAWKYTSLQIFSFNWTVYRGNYLSYSRMLFAYFSQFRFFLVKLISNQISLNVTLVDKKIIYQYLYWFCF